MKMKKRIAASALQAAGCIGLVTAHPPAVYVPPMKPLIKIADIVS